MSRRGSMPATSSAVTSGGTSMPETVVQSRFQYGIFASARAAAASQRRRASAMVSRASSL